VPPNQTGRVSAVHASPASKNPAISIGTRPYSISPVNSPTSGARTSMFPTAMRLPSICRNIAHWLAASASPHSLAPNDP
jgi:hypothetical protein